MPEIYALMLDAARLKVAHSVSLADSIALGEAAARGAKLITCDHHELDAVEESETIEFYWIR